MAKNYIQPGDTVTILAPVSVASGGVVIAGSIAGIAQGGRRQPAFGRADLLGQRHRPCHHHGFRQHENRRGCGSCGGVDRHREGAAERLLR